MDDHDLAVCADLDVAESTGVVCLHSGSPGPNLTEPCYRRHFDFATAAVGVIDYYHALGRGDFRLVIKLAGVQRELERGPAVGAEGDHGVAVAAGEVSHEQVAEVVPGKLLVAEAAAA